MRWWYDTVAALCRAYYARPRVLHAERLPARGPVLYVGTHRNGAVDGCVYAGVARGAEFLISAQLRRSLVGRLFFTGIEVVRDKDAGDRSLNAASLDACAAHLAAGGSVFVLPEGTSDLGPRPLPMKPGAARIAAAALARGTRLTIVPLALHYECAWAFRSRVHVVVGEPFDAAAQPGAGGMAPADALHARIAGALEELAARFADADAQRLAERLAATAAHLGTTGYVAALKRFERGVPPPVLAADAALERTATHAGAARWHGVVLARPAAALADTIALATLAPALVPAAIANLPPLLAAAWAGRRFPDARNVVALWRLLVGLPAFALWIPVALPLAARAGGAPAAAAYAAASIVALLGWDRAKRAAAGLANLVARPRLVAPARELEHRLRDALHGDPDG